MVALSLLSAVFFYLQWTRFLYYFIRYLLSEIKCFDFSWLKLIEYRNDIVLLIAYYNIA